jgi:hypothetical protein
MNEYKEGNGEHTYRDEWAIELRSMQMKTVVKTVETTNVEPRR